MEKFTKQIRFGVSYLLIGMLFILAGVFSVMSPVGTMLALATVMGAIAIIDGVGLVTHSTGNTPRLVVGILEIVIGAFLLLNLPVTASVMPYFFAAWFILHSIAGFFTLRLYRIFGTGYYVFGLVLNIVCVVLGVYLLFRPDISMFALSLLMGFFFILVGVECIALWASNSSMTLKIQSEHHSTGGAEG